MLYYVTGNQNKVRTAKTNLDRYHISFIAKSLPLIEIQSESINEIARNKAEQAYEMLKQPLLVSDHGWEIPELHGFPGPYMKYMNDWLSPNDFLNLTRDLKNRTIIMHDVTYFKNKNMIKIFKKDFKGIITKEIRGKGDAAMSIVTFDGKKTVAEYMEKKISPFPENSLWKEFAEWYKNSQKTI